jgi:hypothetical protein
MKNNGAFIATKCSEEEVTENTATYLYDSQSLNWKSVHDMYKSRFRFSISRHVAVFCVNLKAILHGLISPVVFLQWRVWHRAPFGKQAYGTSRLSEP